MRSTAFPRLPSGIRGTTFEPVKTLRLFALLLTFGIVTAHADDALKAVQTRLARMGYYDGEVDGVWGSQTAAAVRRFQLAKKLRVTGELDAETLRALDVKTKPGTPPKSRAVALADIFVGGPYLAAPPEFQVRTVREAQKNLKLLGFYEGPADGQPNAALTEALRDYQKSNRFKVTGRLDKATLQGLALLTLPPDY